MKHAMTKAASISKAVKEIVAERDSIDGCPCCIICGKAGAPNAHYIPRSRGGLGIPENIVTLCADCHYDYDKTEKRTRIGNNISAYLKKFYPNFSDKDRIFHKWTEELRK
ncbi:MAG: HNH endonuclease [Christensenella sp.]